MDGSAGAGIFLDDINLHTEKSFGKYTTVFQAGVVGIMQTATKILRQLMRQSEYPAILSVRCVTL